MDREILKSLVSITTKKMPYFNIEDGKFENAINVLGLNDRWALIENYFKDKDYNYLDDRELVLSAMIEDFNSMNIEGELAIQKYNFPIEYTMSESTYVEGAKYVKIDLQDASVQAIHYYNLFDFETWSDYVSEFTDEDFTIYYDEELKNEVMHNKYYEHGKVFYSPIFDMAYSQLLYVAMQNGLETFMTEHGCVWCQKVTDSIKFQVVDELKFSTFMQDWPGKFGDIKLHCYVSSDVYKYFRIPDTNKIKKITITTTSDGGKIVSNRGSQYFPQFKKLSLGEPLIEYDYYYRQDGIMSKQITPLNNIS